MRFLPTRLLHQLVRETRLALRSLRRQPAYAGAVILTLALGIGANTAVFSLVHGVLLRPLPYEDDQSLVLLRQNATREGISSIPFSIQELLDVRERSGSFERIVEYHRMTFTLLGREEPLRVDTGVVSAGFFDLLGLVPVEGRFFTPEDDVPGAEAVLVLSHDFWQRTFGGDLDIVGEVFEMNNRPHTVIGILPPVPEFPDDNDVYMSTSACPFRAAGDEARHENRNAFRSLTVAARLAPESTVETARADLARVGEGLEHDHPEAYREGLGYELTAEPLRQELTRRARPTLLLLLATAALVLLIACANVANLTVARFLRRRHEAAVRVALGAGRGDLMRQNLVESLLLSLTGGLLGLGLAAAGFGLLIRFVARLTPRAVDVRLDSWVLLFTLAVAVLAGVLTSLFAGFMRPSRLAAAIHGGNRTTDGRGGLRLRGLLVVAQVAISVLLLVGAGLMLRSFERLQRVDSGFDPQGVLTAHVSLNWTKYDTAERRVELFDRVLERLRSNPRVISAAAASDLPLEVDGPRFTDFEIENRLLDDGGVRPRLDFRVAGVDYFRTVGIPLVRGRTFRPGDDASAPAVAVINQSLAETYWGEEDPLGARVSLDDGESYLEIVGVVGDVRDQGPAAAATDQLYVPLAQGGWSMKLLVRAAGDPEALTKDLRSAVWTVDPEQPVTEVETLAAKESASIAEPRLTAILLGLFAVLALIITVAGLTGVIAFSVSQRTQEIGVRMALGASRDSVLALVFRQGMTLVVIGLALGLAGAIVYGRLFAGFLFEVEPRDPLTLAAVSLILFSAAAFACLGPARRATDVDPTVALRSE